LVLAFFAAYGLNTALHECAHALMAHLLGLPATLFHFYVNINYPSGDSRTRVLCAIAGPLFSLGFGALCWILYKSLQARSEALLFLYFSILGTSIFLGNLFSTSFVAGDFSVAATQLNLPASVRLGMTLAGGLLLAAFLYRMGPELLQWTGTEPTALNAVVQLIVWPVVLGTALVVIAFLPMPPTFIQDWIASSLFWVFAAVGVVLAQKGTSAGKPCALPLQALDLGAALTVLLLVRVLAHGINLSP
jgi:hypothetical protein